MYNPLVPYQAYSPSSLILSTLFVSISYTVLLPLPLCLFFYHPNSPLFFLTFISNLCLFSCHSYSPLYFSYHSYSHLSFLFSYLFTSPLLPTFSRPPSSHSFLILLSLPTSLLLMLFTHLNLFFRLPYLFSSLLLPSPSFLTYAYIFSNQSFSSPTHFLLSLPTSVSSLTIRFFRHPYSPLLNIFFY